MKVDAVVADRMGTLALNWDGYRSRTENKWDYEIPVGSAKWFAKMQGMDFSSFRVEIFRVPPCSGTFTARAEERGGNTYWYGYKKVEGRLRKVYMGRPDEISEQKLLDTLVALHSGKSDRKVTQANLGKSSLLDSRIERFEQVKQCVCKWSALAAGKNGRSSPRWDRAIVMLSELEEILLEHVFYDGGSLPDESSYQAPTKPEQNLV